jgi:integrase
LVCMAEAKGDRTSPPRLTGDPGTPEFFRSYTDAVANRHTPDAGRLRSLILYKTDAFGSLSPSTQRVWAPWLDRISDYFGDLRIAQFDRPEKIRPIIRGWRVEWADTPRTADLGVQVLSRVLSHGVELGRIGSNPCEGIKQLYSADRSQIIWMDADLTQLKATCSVDIAGAVDLAAHTGLRLGDLLRLSWSHIARTASGSRRARASTGEKLSSPLYEDLRAVLARIPRRSTAVLTNVRRRPWTANGFGTAFKRAKIAAGMHDRDLHFHDLRGTAATKFYTAGLPERVIGEIMGWEEEHVSKIIRRYVDRTAATQAIIAQLNRKG